MVGGVVGGWRQSFASNNIQFNVKMTIFHWSSLWCQVQVHVILVKIGQNIHLGFSRD